MTRQPNTSTESSLRAPRVFEPDDPALEPEIGDAFETSQGQTSPPNTTPEPPRRLTADDLNRGIRWGSVLVSAALSLMALAAGLWFTRFVSIALSRQDWVGWVAFALMTIAVVALCALVARELIGFRRLAKLSRLRKSVRESLSTGDTKREKAAVAALIQHYRGRPDMSWGLARLAGHKNDVLEPGDLLRLADRELFSSIDKEARRVILKTAKHVATVTAISPVMWIAMGYVLVANIRMFRALAGLYGGRPGFFGALRLARLVIMHIVATGGVAMTDDLIGQFLGQDLLRRLSRRLGEGAFNGALTSRLGIAAVEVTRPLPFLDSEPLRVREIFAELFRSLRKGDIEEKR